jgi:hypothetical protein
MRRLDKRSTKSDVSFSPHFVSNAAEKSRHPPRMERNPENFARPQFVDVFFRARAIALSANSRNSFRYLSQISLNPHVQLMIDPQQDQHGGRKMADLGERLKDATAETFERYGEFVGRHPGKVLIATLLFTLACLPGLAFIQINLDLYKLFVPSDAPVRHEFEGSQIFNKMPLGNLDADPTAIERVARASKGTFGAMPKRKHKKGRRAIVSI